MLVKSIFYVQQTKRIAKHCTNFQLKLKWQKRLNLQLPRFCNWLKVVIKNEKKNQDFLKKENFFCLGKSLLMQTSNLPICLGIYISICCTDVNCKGYVLQKHISLVSFYWNWSNNWSKVEVISYLQKVKSFY